jgi:hypothetical protein
LTETEPDLDEKVQLDQTMRVFLEIIAIG